MNATGVQFQGLTCRAVVEDRRSACDWAVTPDELSSRSLTIFVTNTPASPDIQPEASVVLADVGVGPVEQLPAGGKAELPENELEFLADGAVAGLAGCPAGEADLLDDGVDLADDLFDDDRDARRGVLPQDLGERADVGIGQQRDVIQATVVVGLLSDGDLPGHLK